MKIPALSGRQREAFSLLYRSPLPAARVARTLGIATAQAVEILAQLEFKGLITRNGRVYAPAAWTFA